MNNTTKGWTLITGATGGLGSEFARIAASNGCNLLLTDRVGSDLEGLAASLEQRAGCIEIFYADLNDLDDACRLWSEACKGRYIERFINNAGLGHHGLFASDEGWERELLSIDVNVRAFSLLLKRATQHMQAQGNGKILNIASIAGFTPGPSMAVYHATKAYVLFLSEAVADELSGTGVSVTALCPGPTDTHFFSAGNMSAANVLRIGKPMSVEVVAKAGWDAAENGARVRVPGVMNKLAAFLPRISPRGVVVKTVKHLRG